MTDRDRNHERAAAAEDAALEALFAEMRRMRPEPTSVLLARVLDDAEGQQNLRAELEARAAATVVTRPAARPARGLGALLAGLGGWGTVGGMATATLTGVWIGLSGTLPSVASAASWVTGGTTGVVELLPGTSDFASGLASEDQG